MPPHYTKMPLDAPRSILTQVLRMCYTCAMKSYDKLYDDAADNYGIITSAKARSLGISNMALVQLARRGRLIHIRRGIYRLAHYVPTEYDDYAQAVASAGDSAYLYGESVIALLNLVPTNPTRIYVAVKGRSRKKLQTGIFLKSAPLDYVPTPIQGIPCQRVGDAIRSAADTVSRDRLSDAALEAYRTGVLSKKEAEEIVRDMKATP